MGYSDFFLIPPAPNPRIPVAMAPMKAAGIKSMTKGAIAEALSGKCELKKSQCSKFIDALGEVGAEGLKGGKFTLPGLCMIKLRNKPATKAAKKEVFGVMREVKAKPARTVVKALPVSALKKQF